MPTGGGKTTKPGGGGGKTAGGPDYILNPAFTQTPPQYVSQYTKLNPTQTQALNMISRKATNTPSAVNNAFRSADDLFKSGGLSGDSSNMAGLLGDYAKNANSYATSAADALQKTASGEYLSGNPYFQEMLDKEAAKLDAQLKSGYSGSGRYGSNAMNRGRGEALSDFRLGGLAQDYGRERELMAQAQGQLGALGNQMRGLQQQAAGQAADIYDTGTGRMLQQQSILPTLDNLRYSGARALLGVGDVYQQQQAAKKADQQAGNMFNYNSAWLPYQNLMGLISGAPYGTTGTTTTYGQNPSTASSILGGALGGGALGSKFGPFGTLLGGLGGGLLGAFG